MKTRKTIEIELTGKRDRLELYLKREAEMLSGGVQSYGTVSYTHLDVYKRQGGQE